MMQWGGKENNNNNNNNKQIPQIDTHKQNTHMEELIYI